MSVNGLVLDIDRFSTHDGPGIRTTVFLKGCPLSCKWCHSPESQTKGAELLYQRARCTGCGACAAVCPAGAITLDGEVLEQTTGAFVHREKCRVCFACVTACPSRAMRRGGVEYSAGELVASIKPDVPFFKNSGGGVTVSGGEPLAQADFTCELLSLCRDLGIHTIMETSGLGSWEDLRRINEVCSAFYFDIKLIDPAEHKKWTGVSNTVIHENLRKLCASENSGEKILIRVPCIPGVNDNAEEIEKIAAFTLNLGIRNIQLLPYNSMAGEKYRWIGKAYSLENIRPRDKSYNEKLNGIVKAAGLNAVGA